MGWDDMVQHPISQDGINLKVDLQVINVDCCIPNQPPCKSGLLAEAPVDMDNMPLPS